MVPKDLTRPVKEPYRQMPFLICAFKNILKNNLDKSSLFYQDLDPGPNPYPFAQEYPRGFRLSVIYY